MKQIVSMLFVAGVLLVFPVKAHADAGDTVKIASYEAGGNIGDINNIIAQDTAAPNPNRVFLLSRGGHYYTNGGRIIAPPGVKFRLVGEPAPASGVDPGPAVIQISANNTGGYDSRFFDINGDIELRNIYFLYWTLEDARGWWPMFWNADSATAVVDNCVFDWAQSDAIEVVGKDMKSVSFTNCTFRNGIDPTSWWAGRIIYFNAVAVGTLISENCTIENEGFGYQQQDNGLKLFYCNHNTFVNLAKFSFLNEQWQKAYITNNVFFNCHFTGERFNDRKGQDPDNLQYGAVLDIDTLYQPPFTAADEAARVVVFKNNSNFRQSWLDATYDIYNSDPLTTDQILGEPIMNARTEKMFTWHSGMVQDHVYDGVDPGFVLAPTNQDSIANFILQKYGDNGPVDWGWDIDQVSDGAGGFINPRSTVVWPLQENLSYTNSTLLTGGLANYPIGDLRWFPSQLTSWESGQAAVERGVVTSVSRKNGQQPVEISLEQNFPNPFNPATKISFTLSKQSDVKLTVFNLLGQKVVTLINGEHYTAGSHTIEFNAGNLASGVYFYRLESGSFVANKKMTLLK
jgi:hypothetical protein